MDGIIRANLEAELTSKLGEFKKQAAEYQNYLSHTFYERHILMLSALRQNRQFCLSFKHMFSRVYLTGFRFFTLPCHLRRP